MIDDDHDDNDNDDHDDDDDDDDDDEEIMFDEEPRLPGSSWKRHSNIEYPVFSSLSLTTCRKNQTHCRQIHIPDHRRPEFPRSFMAPSLSVGSTSTNPLSSPNAKPARHPLSLRHSSSDIHPSISFNRIAHDDLQKYVYSIAK